MKSRTASQSAILYVNSYVYKGLLLILMAKWKIHGQIRLNFPYVGYAVNEKSTGQLINNLNHVMHDFSQGP